MATLPSATLQLTNGSLKGEITLSEDTAIKLGVSTAGPYLRPTRCSQLSSVLGFYHGPLVGSGAHHTDWSGPCLLMRLHASTAGTTGSVTKVPAQAYSQSTLTMSQQSYTIHAQALGGAALALTTGWSRPPAPLAVRVTSGAGTVAHTQTFTYRDPAGDVQTGTLSITAAGTAVTTFECLEVISITSNIDPVGTQDYACRFAGPNDRYDVRYKFTDGGVLGVTGGTTPKYQVSLDDGRTYSRVYSLASAGTAELLTYAGGLTPRETGLLATFAAGTLASTLYGARRVAGADANGDIVYTMLASGVTVTHVVAGMGTALSIGVVASAVTVNVPTDGAGAVHPTNGQALDIAAYLTTSSDAGPVAARLLLTAYAVGTGASLVAAAASAGAPDGGVTYTAKDEGVTVRHVRAGTSTALSVETVDKAITVNVATDSNGAQTSTAANIVTAITAGTSAGAVAANALLIPVATGAGTGIVGALGTYAVLPSSIATGDEFYFSTTPPRWTNSDLSEALAVLLASDAHLTSFSLLHLVGEGADSTTLSTLGTFLANADTQHRFLRTAVVEATHMGSTTESTWATAIKAAYPTRSTNGNIGIAVGEVNTLNSAYGTIDRRNCGTAYMSRTMICPISELPSHVECETVLGIQTQLSGVVVRSSPATTPLWQTEDTLTDLLVGGQNFISLRTHPGRAGIYVRQAVQYVDDGDDYIYVTRRRVIQTAYALAYDEILRFLNATILIDPATGFVAEVELQRMERAIKTRLQRNLQAAPRSHVSAIGCTLDRSVPFFPAQAVTGQVTIVPRGEVVAIALRLGYSATL